MGPKTRRRAAPPSQTTLSFNSKPAKITKPSHDTSSSKDKKSRLSDSAKETVVEHVSTPEPETVSITQPAPEVKPAATEAPSSPAQPRQKKKQRASTGSTQIDPREAAAEKVTDSQIKKYWQKEEESRLAPRVHQGDLPLHEKVLRHFDLSGQYGSCIGITRLARWKRANGLGLEPPVEVLAVLIRELEGQNSQDASGKVKGAAQKKQAASRSQGCSMVAYIDELGGGRVGVVDA